MRISDWSSDVCSSDLPPAIAFAAGTGPLAGFQEKSVSCLLRKKPYTMRPDPKYDSIVVVIDTALPRASTMTMWLVPPGPSVSSEERRVGEEWVWKCRYPWRADS